MKTDIVAAHTVEVGDRVVLLINEVFLVREVNDAEKVILHLEDEEGIIEPYLYEPFDEVTLYLGEDDLEEEPWYPDED